MLLPKASGSNMEQSRVFSWMQHEPFHSSPLTSQLLRAPSGLWLVFLAALDGRACYAFDTKKKGYLLRLPLAQLPIPEGQAASLIGAVLGQGQWSVGSKDPELALVAPDSVMAGPLFQGPAELLL